MPFPYRCALITGATSGIGRALAERLAANGVFVIAVGRRAERLDSLVEHFGGDRVAAEPFDVCDLAGMGKWAQYITSKYPTLDCLILNAGMQRTLSFTAVASGSTDPATALASADQELLTDYTSYLHLLMHLLPHLASQTDDSSSSRRTAIVLVSSGLALVPVPRCAGYCAAKAALHSLAWTLRAQLGSSDGTSHIKVIEIIPPAVQTELHSHQPDLVAIGQSKIGMPLDEFLEEAWAGLERGDEDIFIGGVREHFAQLEDPRRAAFHAMIEHMRNAGIKA